MTIAVTILLLDDEPLLRGATALLLSRRGAQVTVAATADEAVAFARERVYDVAVFDVSQPGPSAAEVIRRICAEALPPKRVISVGSGPIQPAGDHVQVLPRPYPFDSLVRAVFGAGGRRRTRSGVFRTISGRRGAARGGSGDPLRVSRVGRAPRCRAR